MDDQQLRELFGRAVADEPVPLGDVAHSALVQGTRMRQRRFLATGSATAAVVLLLAGVTTLNLKAPAVSPDYVTAPAAALPFLAQGDRECNQPMGSDVSSIGAIFLRADVADEERQALDTRLSGDPLVRSYTFESREAAYQKFKELWKDSPDLVNSVTPEQLPESFRVELSDPTKFREWEARYLGLDGVDRIVGTLCTERGR